MRKTTICLLTLGILFTPIEVKAYNNSTNNVLPTAGIATVISSTEYTEVEYDEYIINNHSGKKTYMSYKTITDKTSRQYELQTIAYTDEYGFRKIGDRYLVAIGTRFNAEVGQYFDAQLDNGEVIKCIIGDIKADCDTDSTNTFTAQGCCLEFIVDTTVLELTVKKMGDCSYLCEEWNSPCSQYNIYNINELT